VEKFIRLWIHEVYRVFYDRLIDQEDRQVFFNMVKETTSNCFKQTLEKVSQLLGSVDPRNGPGI
jgi:dynein heavy chain